MNLRLSCLISIVFVSFYGSAQQLEYSPIWKSEFNIQYHITSQFINRMIDRGHSQVWDDKNNRFISPIYDHLTFPEGINREYSFEMAGLDFGLNSYFKPDFTDFSVERFEEFFKNAKKSEKGTITYDSLGRILEMKRILRPSFNNRKKENFIFDYDGFDKIDIAVKTSSFYFFGNYSSSIAGNIRYRPLRLKTNWELTQYMNSNTCTDSVISNYQSRANIRKNYNDGLSKYYFDYDTIGCLKHEKVIIGADSIYLDKYYEQVDHLLTEKDQSNYWILKSPAVKRWFDSISEPLYTSQANRQRSASARIRTRDFKLIGVFGKNPEISTRLVDYVYDSIGVYKSLYDIRKIDSLDSIPYTDKNSRQENDNSPINLEIGSVRQKGMLDAYATVFRRSEIMLKNGWTIIRYQRGSDGYARVALGHIPPVRLDVLYDRFVFVDPSGDVKYLYHYKKLYKIEEAN